MVGAQSPCAAFILYAFLFCNTNLLKKKRKKEYKKSKPCKACFKQIS
jgi:hypothetical protein